MKIKADPETISLQYFPEPSPRLIDSLETPSERARARDYILTSLLPFTTKFGIQATVLRFLRVLKLSTSTFFLDN